MIEQIKKLIKAICREYKIIIDYVNSPAYKNRKKYH